LGRESVYNAVQLSVSRILDISWFVYGSHIISIFTPKAGSVKVLYISKWLEKKVLLLKTVRVLVNKLGIKVMHS